MLSLEAPVVAVLWQRALAHAHGIRLTPMLDAGLGLACWVIYVIDRTLDTFAVSHDGELDVRHAFYRRHRRWMMLVLPPALVLLAWMAFFVIPEGVLWQAVGLSLLVGLYLASWSAQGARLWRDLLIACSGLGAIMLISHMPASPGYRFSLSLLVLGVMTLNFLRQLKIELKGIPKETAAALLFAMGCTTSTRFLVMPETWIEPVAECGLLALLFACNLHGISAREKSIEAGRQHMPLVIATLVATLLVLWLVGLGLLEGALRGPAQAALVATVLHAAVHLLRRYFSADAYRVLADLVLVLPLPLVWR